MPQMADEVASAAACLQRASSMRCSAVDAVTRLMLPSSRALQRFLQQSTPLLALQTPMILIGSSSGLRYCRLMCSLGSPNTMLLPPPGGFRTRSDDRCDSCKCAKLVSCRGTIR